MIKALQQWPNGPMMARSWDEFDVYVMQSQARMMHGATRPSIFNLRHACRDGKPVEGLLNIFRTGLMHACAPLFQWRVGRTAPMNGLCIAAVGV